MLLSLRSPNFSRWEIGNSLPLPPNYLTKSAPKNFSALALKKASFEEVVLRFLLFIST